MTELEKNLIRAEFAHALRKNLRSVTEGGTEPNTYEAGWDDAIQWAIKETRRIANALEVHAE